MYAVMHKGYVTNKYLYLRHSHMQRHTITGVDDINIARIVLAVRGFKRPNGNMG